MNQWPSLWPHMSVRGNVEWPLKVGQMSKAERDARVDEVLELLDIHQLANRYPNEISGGQQQRVAIARTIAPKPGVLLFDEPLSNLDAKLRIEMRTELMRLHRATGATTVYVTHDQIEAMTMATHVAVMNHGRLQQFGTPNELLESPATSFVATFVGTPPNNMIPVVKNSSGQLAKRSADDGAKLDAIRTITGTTVAAIRMSTATVNNGQRLARKSNRLARPPLPVMVA